MISKAAYFRFHKYLGLIGAAFLLVQSLTGLTLVFGPEIAQLIDPAGMTSGPGRGDASPFRLLTTAESLYPGYHVDRLVYPVQLNGTYVVHVADANGDLRYISLDRHSGAVLRTGSVWHFPVEAALNIHNQWLSGTPGMVLVSSVGTVLLLTAAMGLCFWWPRRGRIKKSLTVQWHLKPRAVLRQLHRTTGVTVSALLAFMAITGLFVSIPMVIGGTPDPWSTTQSFAPRIEPALRLAEQQFPGRAIRDVRMPGPTKIAVFLLAPERNPMAVHRVIIDTRGPRIVSARNAFDDGAPWVIAEPLHNGQDFGIAGQLFIVLIGLSLATLASTGPIMWLQARRARRRSRQTGARPASTEMARAKLGSSL
ncbi:MAG TPA: PepSY-associated TM helix domain-containing protein [Sphingomicrobium sp.]|nr:PepSY-associated TM helix domain-containing protein [Sphingomicrobium sp.]